MTEALRIEIRQSKPEDLAFVFATWLRSYKRSSYFAKRIGAALFFSQHHALIERIVSRPTSAVSIAHPEGDPNTIIGYLVAEQSPEHSTIHFAYTKKSFRELGVMRSLLHAARLDPQQCHFSHWTYDADKLCTKWPEARYNPYASHG